jgi:hypothetical protein
MLKVGIFLTTFASHGYWVHAEVPNLPQKGGNIGLASDDNFSHF